MPYLNYPFQEETKGDNVIDSKVIISQLTFAKFKSNLNICGIIGDAGINSV
jgi:hypothetical protein